MGRTIKEEKLAVQCGYVPIFRYNGAEEKFTLDYKEPNFDLFKTFLEGENRFAMLKQVNGEKADELLEQLKVDAIKRFDYYKSLVKMNLKVNFAL